MPLNHDRATASVRVTGLSVGCFNPETHNWEVALIRHPRHVLTIKVTKKTSSGTDSQLTFQLDDKHTIYIQPTEPIVPPADAVIFKQDPFDRRDPTRSDPEDFRWIVDLEREFNDGQPIDVFQPTFPITALFVSYPVLYADRNDKLDDMQLVQMVAQGVSPPQPFGTIGESGKADISCNPGGSVMLKVKGPLGFVLPLQHIEGQTHEIVIENVCEPAEGEVQAAGDPPPSDFSIYFSLLRPDSGAEFDLQPLPGAHGSDAVCNNAFLGSRTSLFPLGSGGQSS